MREFQRKLSLRLLLWSVFSITSGVVMLLMGRGKFWQRVGFQFITWGGIDAAIAIGGQVASENRLKKTPDAKMPDRLKKDKRNLRIALWVNAGLDVLYMIGGIRWLDHDEDSQRGNGLGVLVQGTFLFFFDLYHAIKLEDIKDTD